MLCYVTVQQDVVDFEGGDGDEEVETPPPAPPPGQRMVVAGPWQAPPETETAARTRLSLYFALCVKSRQMLAGLLEAYVTVSPAAQAGLMTELPLLARAAAKGFGEPGVVGLMGDAPPGAKTLVLAMLDLLVPKEINKPSPELVAAVRRLREARVAAVVHEVWYGMVWYHMTIISSSTVFFVCSVTLFTVCCCISNM